MKELDADSVADRLRRSGSGDDVPGLVLLDVREAWELAIASIPGAVHVPMSAIPARVGTFDPAQPVIVMCHHGTRSRMVAQWLESQGFTDVANFDGGIDAWSCRVDPGVPRY